MSIGIQLIDFLSDSRFYWWVIEISGYLHDLGIRHQGKLFVPVTIPYALEGHKIADPSRGGLKKVWFRSVQLVSCHSACHLTGCYNLAD